MNGIHDLGGRDGFGPVEREDAEPVFHAPWEGRVWSIMRKTEGRQFHLDQFRDVIEHMPPVDYLEASYYERWLHALETLLPAEKDLAQRRPRPERPELKARFRPGDRVRTRNRHPKGHTRMPLYARDKRGVVRTVNGPFLLPDVNAYEPAAPWEACYAVEFAASELWGESANPADAVCVDLWESYLLADEG